MITGVIILIITVMSNTVNNNGLIISGFLVIVGLFVHILMNKKTDSDQR
jgi:hypothetical protein